MMYYFLSFVKVFLSVYKIDILLDTFYKNDRNC